MRKPVALSPRKKYSSVKAKTDSGLDKLSPRAIPKISQMEKASAPRKAKLNSGLDKVHRK